MANVFLSYQKRDAALALRMVQLLNGAGLTVWWDDDLTPRESWDRIIEREIHQADQVLVLWTPNSVQSEWVRIEANYALNCTPSKLVQARFDAAQVPIAFSMRQYVDLDFAKPDRGPSWDRLLSWLGGRRSDHKGVGGKAKAPKAAMVQPSAAGSSPTTVWTPIGLHAALPDVPQRRVFWLLTIGVLLSSLALCVISVGNFYGIVGLLAVVILRGLPIVVMSWNQPGKLSRLALFLVFAPLIALSVNLLFPIASGFLLENVPFDWITNYSYKIASFILGIYSVISVFTLLFLFGGTFQKSPWLQEMIIATILIIIVDGIELMIANSYIEIVSLLLYPLKQLVIAYALSLILTGSLPPWRRTLVL